MYIHLLPLIFNGDSVAITVFNSAIQHGIWASFGYTKEDGDTRGGARMLSDTKIAILSSACIFLKNAYEWVYFIKIAVDVLFYWLRS